MKKLFLIFIIFYIAINSQAQHNVILIIADDIGTDYFGFYEYGKDTVDVPNIRFLLKKGIRFSNAMSNQFVLRQELEYSPVVIVFEQK